MNTSVSDGAHGNEGKGGLRPWLVLVLVYALSICVAMTQMHVPPLASWLMSYFSLNGAGFGSLMSVFTLSGMILAFPAAFVCYKFGLKKTVLFALLCSVVGCLIESLSMDMTVMYASRLIEGIGVGFVGVAAPACVSLSFPDRGRGLALGIWATWMPMGITLIYNTAPAIATNFGWRAVSASLAVACLVLLVLFLFLFKEPEGTKDRFGLEERFGASLKKEAKCLKNKYIWLLGICFFVFSYCSGGVTDTHYNVFLQTSSWHFDTHEASSFVSLVSVIGMAAIPISGWIFDRTPLHRKHYLIMIAAAGDMVGFSLAWNETAFVYIGLFVAISGLGQGFIAGSVRPMVPLVMGNSTLGVTTGMAVLTVFQSLGRVVGSPLFGWGYETLGWWHAALVLVLPVCLLSVIVSFFIRPDKAAKEAGEK